MPLFQNPLSERVYNQNDITVSVNGVQLQGLFEGTPVVVHPRGGEIEITEGTDGPGLNRATKQGGEVRIRLRESSPGHAVLQALRVQQDNAPVGCIVIVSTGVGAVETLINAMVSLPGELSTGEKKMAGVEYTFRGTQLVHTPPVLANPVPSVAL